MVNSPVSSMNYRSYRALYCLPVIMYEISMDRKIRMKSGVRNDQQIKIKMKQQRMKYIQYMYHIFLGLGLGFEQSCEFVLFTFSEFAEANNAYSRPTDGITKRSLSSHSLLPALYRYS